MGKRFIIQKPLLLWLCLCLLSFAQAQPLQVQGIVPNAYITHQVQAKENWYSVGRIYNLSPREIAPFNKLTIEQPLAIGQSIKVPLTTNFTTTGQIAADESLIPLYHKVAEKEWAYRISTNYQIPIENLEAFNKIKRDQVKAGMNLIVGYLKVKTDQSPLSSKAVKVKPGPVLIGEEKLTDPIVSVPPKPATEPSSKTAIEPAPKSVTEPTTKTVSEPVAKVNPESISKPVPPPAPVNPAPQKNPEQPPQTRVLSNGDSYFKSGFEGGKSTSGKAHIFKSSSGFTDGKFYALMNQVPIGTIVKVNANGKSIYAKVLGGLTDMKENNGILIRISNAGAIALGLGETAFTAEVQY